MGEYPTETRWIGFNPGFPAADPVKGATAGTPFLCFYHPARLCRQPLPALKTTSPIHPSLARLEIARAIYLIQEGSIHRAGPVSWALKSSPLAHC